MTPEQELDLLTAEPTEDDAVIHFKVAFPDSPKTYSYAGVKVFGKWYITGTNGIGYTWTEFIAWLKSKNAEVVSIRHAIDWENL